MFGLLVFKKFSCILLLIELTVACITVSTYFLVGQAVATVSTTSQPPPTALQELNKEFRQQYMKARDNFWHLTTENGTIIIKNSGSLTLIHRGIRYPMVKAVPEIFHELKSIAHIPLTVNLLLTDNSPTSSDDTLEQYWKQLNNLQLPDSIELKERQPALRIIRESRTLIRQKIDNRGSVDQSRLTAYSRHISNDLFTLLDAAAIAYLNLTHSIIQNWLNEHNINRYDPSIKVLLIGPRAARQNNLEATYFERLLGDDRKRNIVYIEELYNDEKKVTSIVSTWFFEEQLSDTFFNDNNRMHSDLLMTDTVRQYIIEQLIRS